MGGLVLDWQRQGHPTITIYCKILLRDFLYMRLSLGSIKTILPTLIIKRKTPGILRMEIETDDFLVVGRLC